MIEISWVDEVKKCQLCKELELGARPVFQFNPKAKILIAGQAPGKAVHLSGIPFQDPSGDRLRSWLGIAKETFYGRHICILPMAFCFPGSGKTGDLAPPQICADTWRQKFLNALPNLELTIVLGKYASEYHVGKGSITEWAKRWRELLPHKIVLPHPSPRNNRWLKKNSWFEREAVPALQARIQTILT